MNIDKETLQKKKTTILTDAMAFLRGLRSGEPEERLAEILDRIRANETALLHEQGTMLDPKLWKFLHERLNRRNNEGVDWSQLERYLTSGNQENRS
jgi:hypothetical protein